MFHSLYAHIWDYLRNRFRVNTANALFSLVAFYVIDKLRSGAPDAIQELMALDQSTLIHMILIAVIVAAASCLA